MSNSRRRWIALLLVLVMVLGMMPMVYAFTADGYPENAYYESILSDYEPAAEPSEEEYSDYTYDEYDEPELEEEYPDYVYEEYEEYEELNLVEFAPFSFALLADAALVAQAAADAHVSASPIATVTQANINTMRDGILGAVTDALDADVPNNGFPGVTVEWAAGLSGERATVTEPGIMAGTLWLRYGTYSYFLPLFYEIVPQITFTPPAAWTNRSLVPTDGSGNFVPRNDLEQDIVELTYISGPRLWGSPNQTRAAEYVVSRFNEAIIAGGANAAGATAEVVSVNMVYPDHPEALSRVEHAYIGRFQFTDLHDWYGMAMPNDASFPIFNSPRLVDLGVFPNLATGETFTAGENIVAVVRFSTAHLHMEHQLLPALRQIEDDENINIELVLIARYHTDRPIWNTMTVQFINRPQDAGTNEINFGMLPALPGYDVMAAQIPFITVAHYNLVSIMDRHDNGQLERIYRHQRTYLSSPFLRLPASNDPDNPELVIFLTGHFDSVATTIGVSDNAGSTAAMMELARRITGMDRGGVEFWILPQSGHEAGHNAGSEAFFPGGIGFSVFIDEMVRRFTDEGLAEIGIFYHFDMITSPGFAPGGGAMPNITIGGSVQSWRPPATAATPFNLAQYLLASAAYDIVPLGYWAPGRNTITVNRNGMGEALQAYRDHDIMSSGMATGLEIQYHNTRDNLEENYCYYRLRMSAEIITRGMIRAIDQEISRRAEFNIDLAAGMLELVNAAQLFQTYDRVEGSLIVGLDTIPFVFESPAAVYNFTPVEGTPLVGIRNLFATGNTVSGITNAGTTVAQGRFRAGLVSNLEPTAEHMLSRVPGTEINANMSAYSVGYEVRDPFMWVNGVGYVSNRAFADLIGGRQHYWHIVMNQVNIFGNTTISGYNVDGDYVEIRVEGWRDPTSASRVTYAGWWTTPVPQSFTATITTNGGAPVEVNIAEFAGLTGNLGVVQHHAAAYLPLRFLAAAFGFEVVEDAANDGYVILTPVLFSAEENGSIAATVGGNEITSPAQLTEGDVVVFTATPDAGFRIAEWTITGGTLTGEPTAATREVTVGLEPITVVVTFEPIPMVSVAVQQGTMAAGTTESVTFAITAEHLDGGARTVNFADAGVVANLPTGVTASGTIVIDASGNGTGTLTLTGSAETIQGVTDDLTLTLMGLTSAPFTLTIGAPPPADPPRQPGPGAPGGWFGGDGQAQQQQQQPQPPAQEETARVPQAVANTNDRNEGTSVVVTYVTREIEVQLPDDAEGKTLVTVQLPAGAARDATAMAILNDDLTFTAIPARFNADGTVTVILAEDATLVALSVEADFIDVDHLLQHVQDEINSAAGRMIVQGVGNDRFDPTRSVLTSEAVAMFIRSMGMPTDADAAEVAGINQEAWFAIYINTAVANGLIGGNVSPATPMTRIQTAALLANALEVFDMRPELTETQIDELLSAFSDVDVLTATQRADLAATVYHGIFRGHVGGTMGPSEELTRSQMASLAVRFQNLILGR